jgi:hypothetical protein
MNCESFGLGVFSLHVRKKRYAPTKKPGTRPQKTGTRPQKNPTHAHKKTGTN